MLRILGCFLLICFTKWNASGQFNATFEHFNMANTPAFTTNNFKCIAVGDSNTLFAGSQYGGLYKYDDSLKVWFKSSHLTNVFINDIKTDANGGIWIAQSGVQGTSGGGSNISGGINYFPEWFDLGMIFFNGVDSSNATATLAPQHFNFEVDSLYPGKNQIIAIAAYRNPTNEVDYYIDTISGNTQNQFTI